DSGDDRVLQGPRRGPAARARRRRGLLPHQGQLLRRDHAPRHRGLHRGWHVRIAIVNDEPLAVEALRHALLSVPAYSVAWVARDGAEAVRRCAAERPDVILMDLIM